MERQSFRDRVDTRIATQLDRRLVDRLVDGGGRSRRMARAGSFVMATAVHVATFALVALGVGLVLLGDNWVQRALGIVVLLPPGVLLLPRRSEDAVELVVDPQAAPRLTALLAELAAALRTEPPTYVAICGDINAYAERRGLRQRRLVVGAPLWAALSHQGRIALLGHELGHFSNRDVVHGRYVWWAIRTLARWIELVTPDGLVSTEGRTPVFATIVTAPVRLPLVGYLELVWKVNAAASRHDELRADAASSALAGTPGALESLETILLADVIDVAANRAAVDPQRPDLAVEIRSRIAGVSETARRAIPHGNDTSSVDRTHPSTADRLRLQESLPAVSPLVHLDDAEWSAIDAELRPMMDAALKRMADDYRFTR
ncbi:M48 family metallopeptidase [Nocardioides sp. URHA0020]|uniref:M48 family metallopeptidase n=1 Tax=Nocardioides sp. URHA0020 TaxID=1380392 RepID=UPI0004900494|nr:M48 family metalloprotease [Nocardioides sp. URHA0020]